MIGLARILVVGSPEWSNRAEVERALGLALRMFPSLLVATAGCGSGAEEAAATWAYRAGVECEPWPAGVVVARICLAFGCSPEVEAGVRQAAAQGIPVHRFQAVQR